MPPHKGTDSSLGDLDDNLSDMPLRFEVSECLFRLFEVEHFIHDGVGDLLVCRDEAVHILKPSDKGLVSVPRRITKVCPRTVQRSQ